MGSEGIVVQNVSTFSTKGNRARDANGELGRKLVERMPELTFARHGQMGIDNAYANMKHKGIGNSLADIRNARIGEGDSAVVIAAGPSIKRHDPLTRLKARGYRGAVVVTESAIVNCLRNGIVPDLAVTLDPHPTRIVRWFGDPNLTRAAMEADDYYSRQDMDEAFVNELKANEEALELLDRHGRNIRLALATSASEAVVDRVRSIGMDIYWWNPMYDDPDQPDSRTRALQKMNGFPSVNAGGNVGTCAWMMASAVLGKKAVALTGMDFSYYEGTPYDRTQYYYEVRDLVGEESLDSVFMRLFNPHTGTWFFADPAYMWYRECFLEMVSEAEGLTFNCTGGGILFGGPIRFATLDAFLDEHG